jgi:hypothetical protein
LKKLLVSLPVFLSLAALLYLPAGADDNGVVDVFVTPKLISITVDPDSVDYQTVEINFNDARPSPAGFTVTNIGTVPVDLYIRGDDTRNGDNSLGWTLGSGPGIETYVHRFTTNPTPILADFAPLTKSAQIFLSGVAASGGDSDLKLSLATPTETDNLGPQTTTVTVLATDVGVAP